MLNRLYKSYTIHQNAVYMVTRVCKSEKEKKITKLKSYQLPDGVARLIQKTHHLRFQLGEVYDALYKILSGNNFK